MIITKFDKFRESNNMIPSVKEARTDYHEEPEEPKQSEPKVVEPNGNAEVKEPQGTKHKKLVKSDDKTTNENIFSLNGKIISFNENIKPSDAYKLLIEKNIDKNETPIILIKDDNNIILMKYNENYELKLKEFSNSLIDFYKKHDSLKEALTNTILDGNNTFAYIKNIPSGKIKDKSFIDIMVNDITKLIK